MMIGVTKASWRVAGLGMVAAAALVACGGGSDDSVEIKNCVNFVDSFGAVVSCAEMKNLPGASFPSIEGGGDASSSDGDAGADGSAADGAPIKNTKLVFTDVNGKKLEVTTNDLGQFRINLRGMKAPLVASVERNNLPWKSMLVDDIVRAPKNNKFYTINLTKLTDVVASEMARADGLQGADSLTPQGVLRQRAAYSAIVNSVRLQIWSSLLANNVADPANFDPVRTPFVANFKGADKVLEEVTVNRSSSQTVITAVSTSPTTTPTTPVTPPTPGISGPAGTVSGTVR